MELNRDQVVKALECCNGNECCDACEDCFSPKETGGDCMVFVMRKALALIRELTEENERSAKEIDRLSQVVLYHNGITEMEVEEAKADTVRRMQERLKKTSEIVYGDRAVCVELIDQIAKELLEEGK